MIWTNQLCLNVNLVDFQKGFVVQFKYCDTGEKETTYFVPIKKMTKTFQVWCVLD